MAMLRRSDNCLCRSLGSLKLQGLDVKLSRLVIADLAAETMATANDVLFRLHMSRRTLRNAVQAEKALSSRRIQYGDKGELLSSGQLAVKVADATFF